MVLLIILAILVVILIVLTIIGKRMQKKQAEQKEQLDAAKQTVSLLVIDKKRLPVKDSGLPQMVIDQVPKMMRRSKMPIVKVKIGPKITNMIADEKIFDVIPVKKEVKATISGIYITDVKATRGTLDTPPKKGKGGFRRRLMKARDKAQADMDAQVRAESKKKSKKKKS